MNFIVDIIILLCLGWGAYKGFRKGFFIQSFAFFALILGVWGGLALSKYAEPFLRKYFFIGETAMSAVSFAVVFLIILILVYTSGYLITKVANVMTLGLINRLAGAAFGIFVNALALSVIILILNKVDAKVAFLPKDKLEKSWLYNPIAKIAPALYPEKFFEKLLK